MDSTRRACVRHPYERHCPLNGTADVQSNPLYPDRNVRRLSQEPPMRLLLGAPTNSMGDWAGYVNFIIIALFYARRRRDAWRRAAAD